MTTNIVRPSKVGVAAHHEFAAALTTDSTLASIEAYAQGLLAAVADMRTAGVPEDADTIVETTDRGVFTGAQLPMVARISSGWDEAHGG